MDSLKFIRNVSPGFPDVSIPLETKQVEQQGGRDGAMKADLCTSKVSQKLSRRKAPALRRLKANSATEFSVTFPFSVVHPEISERSHMEEKPELKI